MNKKIKLLPLMLVIPVVPIVALLGFLIFQELKPLPSIKPMPANNGYDVLVKAAQVISMNTSAYDTMNESQLRDLVAANAEGLAIARSGCSNECRVTTQFSQSYMDNHLRDLSSVKRMAQAFIAEGMLAEMENHPEAAAKSCLDAIRYGNESARGGVLIDEMVGQAIEKLSIAHLQKIVSILNVKSCRESATTLEALDAQRQSWADVIEQEHSWGRRAFPGLGNRLAALMTAKILKKGQEQTEQKFKSQLRTTRRVLIDLAARAHELDKGHRPASLADLVPDYLKAIPQDPVTGTNMTYMAKSHR
jgi:hypothetical protein